MMPRSAITRLPSHGHGTHSKGLSDFNKPTLPIGRRQQDNGVLAQCVDDMTEIVSRVIESETILAEVRQRLARHQQILVKEQQKSKEEQAAMLQKGREEAAMLQKNKEEQVLLPPPGSPTQNGRSARQAASTSPAGSPRHLAVSPAHTPHSRLEENTLSKEGREGKGADVFGNKDFFKRAEAGLQEVHVTGQEEAEISSFAARWGISSEDAMQCYKCFKGCDADNSGCISISELRSLMDKVGVKMSDASFDKLIAKFDSNEDGTFTFEEFLGLYRESPGQKLMQLEAAINNIGAAQQARMEDGRLSVEDRVRMTGVQMSTLRKFLKKELREANACLQLPLALALFVTFWAANYMHSFVENLHAVDKSITWDLYENANFAYTGAVPFESGRMGHKNIDDVNSFADFWSWFELGLVPLFWPEGWDVSEARTTTEAMCLSPRAALEEWYGSVWNQTLLRGLNQSAALGPQCPAGDDKPQRPSGLYGPQDTSTYLYYHSIVGGVRLRQERSPEVRCPAGDSDVQKAVHSGYCIENTDYWLAPEVHRALYSDPNLLDQQGGETVYLLSRQTQQQVRRQLRDLENRVWFGPHTAKVDIMFTTYNPHMDILTATFIFFFVNRGGHMHKIIEPVSIWMTAYHGWYNYVFDASWILLVLNILIVEANDIKKHWQQLGFRRGIRVYANIVNMVDWCSVAYCFVISSYWAVHVWRLSELRATLKEASVDVVGSWTDTALREEFYDQVEAVVSHTQAYRLLVALYPFMIVLRLFNSFSAQPRLALATKTMYKASTDIFHFGIVFASIFVIYAVSANILFGQELLEFANMSRSTNTVFRILLGDFDWESMHRVGRPQAGLWFWGFMWIVNLVMLNMLLAIIMDVYTEVKSSIGGNAETVVSQTVEIFTRWKQVHMGNQLSLQQIVDVVDPTGLDDADDDEGAGTYITVSGFMLLVPNLSEPQALEILIGVEEYFASEVEPATPLSQALIKIQRVDRNLSALMLAVETLLQMNTMVPGLILSSNDRMVDSTTGHNVAHGQNAGISEDMFIELKALITSYFDDFGRSQAEEQQRLDRAFAEMETKVSKLLSSDFDGPVYSSGRPQRVASASILDCNSQFQGFCAPPIPMRVDNANRLSLRSTTPPTSFKE